MWVRPSAVLGAADAEHGGSVLSVAILEPEDRPDRLASLVADRADLTIGPVSSLQALLDLVAGGTVDAIVVDPELPDGWPSEIVHQLTEQLGDRVPVVVVCRSEHDAAVITARDKSLPVLVHERLDADGLVALLKGELARRRGGPRQR